MLEKLFTKENIVIAVAVFILIAQSNYFATKLDIANLKLEMAQMNDQLKAYSDNGDKEILKELDSKYQNIINKLDRMK